jgi:hypothetical protein
LLGSSPIFELSYDLVGDATVTITAVDGLSILAQQQIDEGTSFPRAGRQATVSTPCSQLPEVDWPFLTQRGVGFSICEAGNCVGQRAFLFGADLDDGAGRNLS